VEPFRNDFLSPETVKTYWLLMGAVFFVLLIACVNVANLLLARGTGRQKEVAVRAALGATRRRLFAQFLIESLLLSIFGGALGIALAESLIKVVMAIIPTYIVTSEADIRISTPVLLFTLGVSVLAAMGFGCAPAWRAAQTDPNEALKEGGRAGTGVGAHSLRRALVVVEFSLALTLLAAAGLAIHSFWNLSQRELGMRRDHILTFLLPMPATRLTQPEKMVTFYRQLVEKLEAIPGISRATACTGLPVESGGFGKAFSIAGRPVADQSSRPDTSFRIVTPEYFDTFGIRVTKGRSFTDQDTAGGVPVAMVNQTFVRLFLSDVDPLSQRLLIDRPIPGGARNGAPMEWQIIGVFHDVRLGSRGEDIPEVDVSFWQNPWPLAVMGVRTAGDPEAMTRNIADAVQSMDPDLPLAGVRTMDQVVIESRVSDRFATVLYGGFALLALLLAAVGIYGVMAFVVEQRTHEIGLRMALGAGRQRVFRLILKEGAVLALAGTALGLGGACLVGSAMRGMLYGVGTIDLGAFAGVSIVLLATAIFACYIPARRAANVEPMVALRYE
jgi:putative ABC transport system permease protein